METLTEILKLLTTIVALVTAIVTLLSKTGGRNDRDDRKEGR